MTLAELRALPVVSIAASPHFPRGPVVPVPVAAFSAVLDIAEAAQLADEQFALLDEAERIDREMGYPLPGDSALALYLSGLDERRDALRAALAALEGQTHAA